MATTIFYPVFGRSERDAARPPLRGPCQVIAFAGQVIQATTGTKSPDACPPRKPPKKDRGG